MNFLSLGIAAAAGLLMAVQGTFNGNLSKTIGLVETTFVVHLIGTIVLTIMIFVFHMGEGDLRLLKDAPKYTLLSGVISVGIIYMVAFAMTKSGPSAATTAIIVGQVLTSFIIDNFGLFNMGGSKITWLNGAGILIFFIGAFMMLKK